jgi:hypothetical protein
MTIISSESVENSLENLRLGREQPRIEVEGAGLAPYERGIAGVAGIEENVEFLRDDYRRYSDSEFPALS